MGKAQNEKKPRWSSEKNLLPLLRISTSPGYPEREISKLINNALKAFQLLLFLERLFNLHIYEIQNETFITHKMVVPACV